MQFDPNLPQPHPCNSCSHEFEFYAFKPKHKFAIAMEGRIMGLFCSRCEAVTIQKLKGGFFRKPKFVILECLPFVEFALKYPNTELGFQLIAEVNYLKRR